ncbi:MAG: hypothetical protein ACJ746_24880 [Bryobacteraceae bacterium]
MNILINDQTVLRATATFLRTAVTRNTAWDKFLAGDHRALTPAERRGAKLFFTPAGAGGAGCFSCHTGPMLNKQHDDPEVSGVSFSSCSISDAKMSRSFIRSIIARLALAVLCPRTAKTGLVHRPEDVSLLSRFFV